MTSHPLDYALSPPAWRRLPWRALAAAAFLLVVSFCLTAVPVREDESRMDAVTGSMTSQTIWLGCLSAGPRPDVSPLEVHLSQRGIPWTPRWQSLHAVSSSSLGYVTSRGCASAPPIYSLRTVLKEFVAAASDDEIRAFVRVMESGTEEQQRAAVDAAGAKALQ
jgi:hypothetical protein